jgi:alanine racemase
MANSAAIFSLPETLFEAVRPGIALYGCSPFQESFGLEPVMKVRTRIIALRNLPAGSPVSYGRTFITRRKSRIAVVPIGYADGYDRRFSNNAEMLIRGSRVSVVGRICMDLSMLDVTDVPEASEGDEVVVLGSQGSDVITASELAQRIDTIPYEILTALGSRSIKEYIH